MHNMGQLWLRAEVQNLETSVKKGTKGAPFSPYLVLDADALTKYFHMVSQLMASKKFIMVVPSVGKLEPFFFFFSNKSIWKLCQVFSKKRCVHCSVNSLGSAKT